MRKLFEAKGIRVDDNNLVSGRRYENTGKSQNWGGARKKVVKTAADLQSESIIFHEDAKSYLNEQTKLKIEILKSDVEKGKSSEEVEGREEGV